MYTSAGAPTRSAWRQSVLVVVFVSSIVQRSLARLVHGRGRPSLFELGSLYDSHKITFHRYDLTYERVFERVRDQPLRLLEIGALTGASAKMWLDYFPNAEIHLVDINPAAGAPSSERLFFHQGDQASVADWARIEREIRASLGPGEAPDGPFLDFVIDDGGHMWHQQRITFETTFPWIRPGGVFFCEDLETSYTIDFGVPDLGGVAEAQAFATRTGTRTIVGHPRSGIEFFKSLVDVQNRMYIIGDEGRSTISNRADHDIRSILFSANMVSVEKGAPHPHWIGDEQDFDESIIPQGYLKYERALFHAAGGGPGKHPSYGIGGGADPWDSSRSAARRAIERENGLRPPQRKPKRE